MKEGQRYGSYLQDKGVSLHLDRVLLYLERDLLYLDRVLLYLNNKGVRLVRCGTEELKYI